MKCPTLIIALTCLLSFAGCVTHRITRSAAPNLQAAITTNQGIIDSLTSSQQDSAAMRQAITALRDSNAALHRLNSAMQSNLDRADYKTAILLK